MTIVNNYAPNITTDCGEVYFSHPAFVGGFGEPNGYLLYVNGVSQPYTPGTQIKIADEGQPWQVTFKATYEGKTFEHQIGQSKGVSEVCEVIYVPEQPSPEFRSETVEGEPNCDDFSVPVTITEYSAGYYLGDDNEWHLGDFFPTGKETTDVRPATAEECPAPPVGEEEEPEPDEDFNWGDDFQVDCDSGTATYTFWQQREGFEKEEYTDSFEASKQELLDAGCTIEKTESPVEETETVATVTQKPEPEQLAVTGGGLEWTALILGAVFVAAGLALYLRKPKR